MSEEEKKEKGFQVKDRRRFTEGGEHREKEALEEPPVSQQAAAEGEKEPSSQKAEAPEEEKKERGEPAAEFPEINFATFVFSLSSSVLIHLGLAPDPVTGEKKNELGLAKQTIDILGMLEEKTKGNLTNEEKQLMESILYDLRLRYVEAAKQ